MQGNLTVALIQPECLTQIGDVELRMGRLGIFTFKRIEFCWDGAKKTDETIRKLYPKASEPLIEAAKRHLYGHCTPVFLLGGQNAVQKLFEVVGHEVDPSLCTDLSLRYQLCRGLRPIETEDGWYFMNGIHCPKDREEAKEQVQLFFGFSL